jgi:hypothetical protein
MVMSSTTGGRNPGPSDYSLPRPSTTPGGEGVIPMPIPRSIDPAARNIGNAGPAINEATVDTGHLASHPAPKGSRT